MTSKRNLGPILAIAAAAIAIAAVLTGFIIIGGPGDARDRRLDGATMSRVEDAISVAQCALNVTGSAPASIEEGYRVRPAPTETIPVPTLCGGDAVARPHLTTGDQPAAPGDVVYRANDATHVRICGNFRRPRSDRDNDYYYGPLGATYPQLSASRPAGVHCYDIELVKGASLSSFSLSHAGHMDVFE